nr:MAG TPA: hypothetical protein [Inoviridae sp.]
MPYLRSTCPNRQPIGILNRLYRVLGGRADKSPFNRPPNSQRNKPCNTS